ncbi:MAG: hypothetical protein HC827_10015 [Cyanobacteria bacterium RM1_2_2]|nr:hypothetical protein [Cyanobacteria bacterium RM1_2_2]
MSRFSRIRNAKTYSEALVKLQAWEDERYNRLNNGVGTRGPRPPQTELALTPFGLELDAGEKALSRAASTGWTALSASVGTRASTTLTGAVKLNGYKPARLVAFFRTGGGTAATSEITGMKYLKYAGARHSVPFGASTATEREYDAFQTISAAIRAGGPNRTVSYSPEVFRAV